MYHAYFCTKPSNLPPKCLSRILRVDTFLGHPGRLPPVARALREIVFVDVGTAPGGRPGPPEHVLEQLEHVQAEEERWREHEHEPAIYRTA